MQVQHQCERADYFSGGIPQLPPSFLFFFCQVS